MLFWTAGFFIQSRGPDTHSDSIIFSNGGLELLQTTDTSAAHRVSWRRGNLSERMSCFFTTTILPFWNRQIEGNMREEGRLCLNAEFVYIKELFRLILDGTTNRFSWLNGMTNDSTDFILILLKIQLTKNHPI